jgi:hypothetical protein
MSSYIPNRELEAEVWLNTFGNYVQTFFPELFITETVGNEIQAKCIAFSTALEIEDSARIAYENAIQAKNNARRVAESAARTYGQKFRADLRVAPYRLTDMGLSPRTTTRTPGVLNPASDLVASVDAQTATASLKWTRNGSSKGTIFVIEESLNGSGTWSAVTTSTKTRVDITGITPGIERAYRVVATRKSEFAGASNVAEIYSPSLRSAA